VSDARAGLASLSLKDFRNFERLELQVPAAGMVVIGENGQGKTNLLESVYYLSLFRSVRGARDSDVTRFGAAGFYIEAVVRAPDARRISIGFDRLGRKKRVKRDEAVIAKLSDALGALPVVMFSPADVQIVAGTPAARRRYLDVMLALSSRGYLNALQQYRAALERRNAALRGAGRKGSRDTSIEVWEPALAEFGAVLIRSRRAWVSRYAEIFSERCARVGERSKVELRYDAAVDANAESVELALAEAIGARRGADVRLGLTTVGPHRDDLPVLLDGRDMRAFGSAGQQRSAAVSLRTLEADTLRMAREAAPVFLLDDPFAELDERRAARVMSLMRDAGLGQTILTVPRASDIPASLLDLPRCRVVDGRISWEAAA
jgi:DNA replication and repair protein RecF